MFYLQLEFHLNILFNSIFFPVSLYLAQKKTQHIGVEVMNVNISLKCMRKKTNTAASTDTMEDFVTAGSNR